jgi:hypothetical protein
MSSAAPLDHKRQSPPVKRNAQSSAAFVRCVFVRAISDVNINAAQHRPRRIAVHSTKHVAHLASTSIFFHRLHADFLRAKADCCASKLSLPIDGASWLGTSGHGLHVVLPFIDSTTESKRLSSRLPLSRRDTCTETLSPKHPYIRSSLPTEEGELCAYAYAV